MLFEEMIGNLKKVGVDTIYTFVGWSDSSLLKFFNNMEFQKGNMFHLELKV